ncbi:Ubiquitin carboxyl-terminal hydrolase 14 [Termitomyces sp. T112]|nr:Ubiquitin carboxyl-terminal hydrolase 14 [Termitomyces sp. T112]
MSCPHLESIARLSAPKLSQSVHREECTQCFDSQDLPPGIEVCLSCFNGACSEPLKHHAQTHIQRSGHHYTLNVKRKPKPSSQRTEDDEPPAKMTKLAIVGDREEDRYETSTVVKCWACEPEKGRELPEAVAEPKIKSLVDGVMHSLSSARQSEVKSWEEEITPCEHTLTLNQSITFPIPASGLAQCASCDLKENLWLCLTCGSLGCGRQQFGGAGGNGHGLEHWRSTRHPVSVKLGTITPEGGADVYCYACDDPKSDPEVAAHLASFGINVQTLSKTEKTMTELQIEQNLKYDFSLTSEDGQALEPLFGPGLTGLANLGNSCYIASTLQALFSLHAFQARYNPPFLTPDHALTCPEPLPASCIECQLRKIADGLLSGRYAVPRGHVSGYVPHAQSSLSLSPPQAQSQAEGRDREMYQEKEKREFQVGLRPSGLKELVGRGHAEFGTMRQQDAEEFFGWLVEFIRRDARKFGARAQEDDATRIFTYALEQRLQCSSCGGVRYRVDNTDILSIPIPSVERAQSEPTKDEQKKWREVDLIKCVEMVLGEEDIDGWMCSVCQTGVRGVKYARFKSFPQVFVVHAKKFQLVNWVPTKLDVPLVLPPGDVLEFGEAHLGRGISPGETALPEDAVPAPTLPTFDATAMAQLEGMGFPTVRAQKALLATGNRDAETAMEWLFQHMEDPDIDAPIVLEGGKGQGAPEPAAEQVALIQDMGFTMAQGTKALRETGGDMERAVEWLFSHPDDMGDEPSSGSVSAPSVHTQAKELPGTTGVPVRYRLKAFVSHKGPSVHSGHYVAHVRVPVPVRVGEKEEEKEEWVFFNDEKVVKADEESVRELKGLAYLYFFERI